MVKLIKNLVYRALKITKSAYIYFVVVKFTWQPLKALRTLTGYFYLFNFLITNSNNFNLFYSGSSLY